MILLNDLTSEVLNICPIYGLILNSDGTVTVDFDPSASPSQQTDANNLVATYSGNVTSDIGYSPFGPETITSTLISSGAIISGKLGNYVVNPINITSGAVISGHIGDAAINANNIASGAITADSLGNNVIVSGSIASGAVGQFHLSSGAVNSGHIGNNAVVSGSIASGQIGIFHIASGVLNSVISGIQQFSVSNQDDYRLITSLSSGSNQGNAEANLTYDGTTLNLQSVASGSTVFNIDGVSGNLFSIKDTPVGADILSVENASGNLLFAISSEGYQKTLSCVVSGQNSNIGIFGIYKNVGNAAFFDYYCKDTISLASRAGTIYTVWDETNDTIDYTETSTNDINGSTNNIYFSNTISATGLNSGKMLLVANISSGSWNIKVGARVV
jgi:hypothetical protein